jgi:hypothetical protein
MTVVDETECFEYELSDNEMLHVHMWATLVSSGLLFIVAYLSM